MRKAIDWVKRVWERIPSWIKQWWPILLIGLMSIIFIPLVVINQWIGVESARYLLSATVQALAALLAIIFAGVAILWGQETPALSKLDTLSEKYIKMLRKKVFVGEGKEGEEVEAVEIFMSSFLNVIIYVYEDPAAGRYIGEVAKETETEPFTVFAELLSEYSFKLRGERLQRFKKRIDEDMEALAYYHPEKAKELSRSLEELIPSGTMKRPEDLFHLLKVASSYLGLIRWFNVDRYRRNGTRKILDDLDSSLRKDRVGTLLRIVFHGKHARGPWFKGLIALYTITIAVGMGALSVLKRDICDLHATLIAIGPLLLALCALVLTFVYLYNYLYSLAIRERE